MVTIQDVLSAGGSVINPNQYLRGDELHRRIAELGSREAGDEGLVTLFGEANPALKEDPGSLDRFFELHHRAGVAVEQLVWYALVDQFLHVDSADASHAVAEAKSLQGRYRGISTHALKWLRGGEVVAMKQQLDDGGFSSLVETLSDESLADFFRAERGVWDDSLSIPEESVVHMKNAAFLTAIKDAYRIIKNKLPYVLEVSESELTDLDLTFLQRMFRSAQLESRVAAYNALFTAFGSRKDELIRLVTGIADDWVREAKKRRHTSNHGWKAHYNRFSHEYAEGMYDAIASESARVWPGYIRRKMERLGCDHSRYHLFGQLTKVFVPFEQMVTSVLNAAARISPQARSYAEQIITEERWDSNPNVDKMDHPGRYFAIPGETPFVITNNRGDLASLCHMAHEFGSAVHVMYTNAAQPFLFHQDAGPLIKATAPLLEFLALDEFSKTLDEDAKRAVDHVILDRMLWLMTYQGLKQQSEIDFYEKLGESIDDFGTRYRDRVQQYFGSDLAVPDVFADEMLFDDLLLTPFTYGQYAMGTALGIVAFDRLGQDPGFTQKWEGIMSLGKSRRFESVAEDLGFSDPQDLVVEAYKIVERRIDALYPPSG